MDKEPSYLPPLDPDVANVIITLSDTGKEFWSERAAILEFEAGFTRQEAEAAALVETLRWLRNGRAKQ